MGFPYLFSSRNLNNHLYINRNIQETTMGIKYYLGKGGGGGILHIYCLMLKKRKGSGGSKKLKNFKLSIMSRAKPNISDTIQPYKERGCEICINTFKYILLFQNQYYSHNFFPSLFMRVQQVRWGEGGGWREALKNKSCLNRFRKLNT